MIRDFDLRDIHDVIDVLEANNQLGFPEVDGAEAMRRVKACSAAIFLVYEVGGEVVGCNNESPWDGSVR